MSRRRKSSPAPWTSAASRRLLKLADEIDDVSKAIEIVARKYLEVIPHPPTDLKALGRCLGVLRFEAEASPFSGELRRETDGFSVVYSTFLSPARRRFTIAHELAHALFESTGPNCPRVGKELERLCDMIATEFLMPRHLFLQESGGAVGVTWRKVDELSHLFRTSLAATSLRCAELLGLTFLEVEKNEIVWACGSISKGPLAKLDDNLRRAIGNAKQRLVFDDNLLASIGSSRPAWWRLESRKIGTGDKVYILLCPLVLLR